MNAFATAAALLACASASAIAEARPQASKQARPHGVRTSVPPAQIEVDDGDTFFIRWTGEDSETVRVLGIDAPETRHAAHDIPYAQPFGPEAHAFAQGVLAAADKVEILRAATLDAFGRTLAYVFVGGRNYSVLIVEAHLAEENIGHFGDNGFPKEAAQVLEAFRRAGPVPFESPVSYRARMRRLSERLRDEKQYPAP
jgi:endonuclease YncB( thermonuclease family)